MILYTIDEAGTGVAYRRAVADRLAANPSDPDALFVHAAILATERRYEGAMQAVDRLLEIAPDYPGAWSFRARLYAEMGKPFLSRICASVNASFYA